MNAPRRNEVDVIAHFAPDAIGHFVVPLTPARAARLTDFCARHGINAQALVVDLIDDVIFDMTPACAPAPTEASARADISSRSSAPNDRSSADTDVSSIGGRP